MYDRETRAAYWRVKWKPPLYTGDSVYSYEIEHWNEGVTSDGLNWKNEVEFQHMIRNPTDDEDEDGFIHYEGIWTTVGSRIKFQQYFMIVAINDNGEGNPYENITYGKKYTCVGEQKNSYYLRNTTT